MHTEFIASLGSQHVYQSQEMTHEIWGDGRTLDARFDRLLTLLAYADGSLLTMQGLVDQQGALVASLKAYTLLLNIKGRLAKTLGIGAVFTPVAFRGQGLAPRLLKQVLTNAEAQGFEAALLYSDIQPTYYEQFGFTTLPADNAWIMVDDLPLADASLELAKASAQDAEAMLCWFRAANADRIGPARDGMLWDFFRQLNGPVDDYVVSECGKQLGYISVQRQADHLLVNEICVAPGREKAIYGLLRTIAQQASCSKLQAWHPTFVPASGLRMSLRERKKEVPMLAALNGSFDLAKEPPAVYCFSPIDHF